MTGPRWTPLALRMGIGLAVLAFLVWRLGTGPFLDGLHRVDSRALLAAIAVGMVTTIAAAWRWTLVSRGLGVALPLSTAVAAYYRSQFLNTTLPGGVVGDVHRGVVHGRDAGDVGRGLRAVAWERCAGQVVQVLLTVVVVTLLPSPVRSMVPILLVALGLLGLSAFLVLRNRTGASRWARVRRAARTDLRLFGHGEWVPIALASVVVVAGHVATFLIAVHVAGSRASVAQLLPLVMLVLVAMAIPANVGGWGPREGASAALFAAAGLGADQGLAAATAYGVMVFVVALPGAAVLVVTALRSAGQRALRTPHDFPMPTTYASSEVAASG